MSLYYSIFNREKHPLSKPEPQPRQTGLPISDALSEQLAEAFRSMTAAVQGFQEDYDMRLKRWYGRYGDYLRKIAALKDRARRTIILNLTLLNKGSCPAEDIDMMFHFPDGFDVYDEESQPESPEEPTPLSPGYASPMWSIPASILRPQIPQLPHLENRHAPKIRKTNSYDVTFHCNRLKHDFLYRCRPLYLAFDSFDVAQSFSFTYNIHAANAPLPRNDALHVILEKQT
jgi:hypothetical protein